MVIGEWVRGRLGQTLGFQTTSLDSAAQVKGIPVLVKRLVLAIIGAKLYIITTLMLFLLVMRGYFSGGW